MTLVTGPLPPAPSSAMPASVMPGLRTPSYKLFTRKELCNMTRRRDGRVGEHCEQSVFTKVRVQLYLHVMVTKLSLTLR